MSMFFRYSVGLWCLLLCCTGTGQAQTAPPRQDYLFEHFSPATGLSQGSGYAVCSFDSFMWFGTQDGLNRFDGYAYKVYKTSPADGLRDKFIQCLLADSRGRFWVGTVRGVDLYDRQQDRFKPISTWFAVPANHPVNTGGVRRLLEDRQGGIWLMTDEQGVYRFDPKTGEMKGFLQQNNRLVDMTLAPNGTVWLVSDEEVYAYDSASAQLLAVGAKTRLGLPATAILRAVVSDAGGNIWAGTYEHGIYVLKPRGPGRLIQPREVVHYQKTDQPTSLSGNQISCLFRDRQGRIWVGTRTSGISLFEAQTNTFAHLRSQENDGRSLASNYVLNFFEDHQHSMWVGLSGEGIDKFDPRKAPFRLIRRDPALPPTQTLADNMVYKVLARGNQLYIGTQAGGLSVCSLTTGAVQTFLPQPGNPASILHNQVHDIVTDSASDSAQNLWLATGRGLCLYTPRTGRFTSYLQADQPTLLYLYALGLVAGGREIWVGGQRGLYRFDVRARRWLSWQDLPAVGAISTFVIRLIFQDSAGVVWLGTLGHGLLRYDPRTKTITAFDQKKGLSCSNIRSLKEVNNTLWVGTDCGLYALNLATLAVAQPVTERDGLPNNVIYGILTDTANYLWLSTNKGLTRYRPARPGDPPTALGSNLKNYAVSDGLQSNEFNTNAACQRPDGTLFFGGVKGVTYFRPGQLLPNRYVPPVRITSVRVLDSLYAPNQPEIRLGHRQNFIDFSFVAFNFSNTEKNTYRYRLDGINPEWVRAGTRNFASYTNLPSGTYVFRVKGSNDDGLENPQEASLRVVIAPVYYETWWFRVLLGLVGAGLLVLAYRNHLTVRTMRDKLDKEEAVRQQKEAELKEASARFQQRIAETEMSALRAQMNPHFIFNCLNSIKLYTLQNDTDKASDYLSKFARLIRLVLENSRADRVPLQHELDALRLYIELEAMRFKEKVQFAIIVSADIDQAFVAVPPLLIQPYVENAIWHGLMHKPGGGTVTITVSQPDEACLHVEITDNGIGRARAEALKSKSAGRKTSIGMQVTADRIRMINQLYNIQTSARILDLIAPNGSPLGTSVVLEIPV